MVAARTNATGVGHPVGRAEEHVGATPTDEMAHRHCQVHDV
jgi:hypothetical protein